jgi:hypothetical protein
METHATTVPSRLNVGQNWLTSMPLAGGHDRRYWTNLGYLLTGVLCIAVPLFYMGLFGIVKSDHNLHVQLIEKGIETGNWPVHFLFPVVTYALSGFSHDYNALSWAALIFLTVCVLAKGYLTYAILARKSLQPTNRKNEIAWGWSRETLVLLVSGALMLAAPIARPWRINRVYIGQVSPNVWHNPTILVCWPLVILLFFAAYEFLRSGKLRSLAVVGALSVLSVLAKPNYFLAFAPVFALLSLWSFGLSRRWVVSQLATLPTVAILYWQMTAAFGGAEAMRAGRTIAWMPLAAWRVYSDSILLSLLFSLAFPLSYAVVFRRSLVNRELLVFAWAVLLSALVWTACFAEVNTANGAVDVHFNFSWGSHLAIYLLFFVTAIDMCDNPAALEALGRLPFGGWQARLPWWLLGAHAASGIFWIVRQAVGRGYY